MAIWARTGKGSVGGLPRVRIPGSMVRGHRTGRKSLTSQGQAPDLTDRSPDVGCSLERVESEFLESG